MVSLIRADTIVDGRSAIHAMHHEQAFFTDTSHSFASMSHARVLKYWSVYSTGLPPPERFSASALVGLVNRHAGKPFILGKINPNDALWLSSAQEDGILPSNDTVQNVASLKDLATLALGQGMLPLMTSCHAIAAQIHFNGYEELIHIYKEPSTNAGALEAVVLYSATELWSLPTVATLAGVYKAVPLVSTSADSTLSSSEVAAVLGDLPVRFDARGAWQDAEQATEWALSNIHRLCNSTASLVVVQVTYLTS